MDTPELAAEEVREVSVLLGTERPLPHNCPVFGTVTRKPCGNNQLQKCCRLADVFGSSRFGNRRLNAVHSSTQRSSAVELDLLLLAFMPLGLNFCVSHKQNDNRNKL